MYVNPCNLRILGDLKIKYFMAAEYTNLNTKALKEISFNPSGDYEISPLLIEFYIKQILSK